MKFTPGPTIAEASGTIGGTTYSRNRYGAYTRKRSNPVNPDTEAQRGARNVFAQTAQEWRTGLTAAERMAYNAAAALQTFTDTLGQTYTLSGQALFMKLNIPRIQNGSSIFTAVPVHGAPVTVHSVSVTADSSPDLIELTYSATFPANSGVQIWATQPISAGTIYVPPHLYRQIRTDYDPVAASPIDITTYWENTFGELALEDVGKKISVLFRPISPGGYFEPAVEASCIIT